MNGYFSEGRFLESEVPVDTKITTIGDLLPSDDAPSSKASQEEKAGSSSQTGDSTMLEGWQMSWEQGMYVPNISWLKSDGPYGIFESARSYTTAKGTIGTRQIFKKRMEFSPPPLTTTMAGTLPPMLSFFTTPAFFFETCWGYGCEDTMP